MWIRNSIASLCSLGVIYAVYETVGSQWWVLALLYVLLILAAIVIHRAALAQQLLARAVWWSALALGTVLCVTGNGRETKGGALISLGCGIALIITGRRAFEAVGGTTRNVPPALRSMLMLLMIFALADAQTFLTFASIPILKHSDIDAMPPVFGAIGAAYVAGFVGLYRLEIWGAIVNIVTSFVAVGVLTMTNVADSWELRDFLLVICSLHIVTALPVTIAALRGKNLPSLPARARDLIATGVVGFLMLISVAMYFAHLH
jgi:hypothetical protein